MAEDAEMREDLIAQLEKRLHKDANRYDDHVQYIKVLREDADLTNPPVMNKLRHARERMSQHFPLTEDLWREWIEDEQAAAQTEDDYARIQTLFERAQEDYLSATLWIRQCQFETARAQLEGADDDEDDDDEDDIEMKDGGDENMRLLAAAERLRGTHGLALAAAGQHYFLGKVVWEAAIGFELKILQAMMSKGQDMEELEQQQNRLLRLHERHIGVPLFNMEETYEKYLSFLDMIEATPKKEAEDAHVEAVKLAEKYDEYESELMALDDAAAKWAIYEPYLKNAEKDSRERAWCLHERMVADLAVHPHAWLSFVHFADHAYLRVKPQQALSVHDRALRNCPWSLALWQEKLLALEIAEKPYDVVKQTFEAALAVGFAGANDYVELWMSYLNYHFRRVGLKDVAASKKPKKAQVGDEAEGPIADWRAIMSMAEDYVSQYLAEQPTGGRLQLYKARIEADHFHNVDVARQAFEVLTTGSGEGRHAYQIWAAFAQFERRFGAPKDVRKVLKSASREVQDFAQAACQDWLTYEREESGDLRGYLSARRTVEERLSVIAARQQKAAEKHGKEAAKVAAAEAKAQKKRAHAKEGASAGQAPPKRSARAHPVQETAEDGPQSKRAKTQVGAEDAAPGPGPYQPDEDAVKRTVIVKNLGYDIGDGALRDRFKDVSSLAAGRADLQLTKCGEIRDIRIPTNPKNGRSKGFAYIEFASDTGINPALSKDRQFLEGRPMLIERCVTDSSQRETKFKHSTDLDRRSLFVKNVDYSASEEEVRALFAQYGAVRDLRTVTKFDGKKRDFYYIDFEKEDEASAALLALDDSEFKGRKLQVAFSNPPKRKTRDPTGAHSRGESPAMSAPTAAKTASGHGAPPARAAARPMIPRALGRAQKKSRSMVQVQAATAAPTDGEAAPTADAGATSAAPTKPKSNADFRAMLLAGKK